jgi:hypothetical protein
VDIECLNCKLNKICDKVEHPQVSVDLKREHDLISSIAQELMDGKCGIDEYTFCETKRIIYDFLFNSDNVKIKVL